MRISRFLAAAVVAAVVTVGFGPATASAQFQVRRAQIAPAERTEAQVAAFGAVSADLNALFDAQRAFFREHGRYAATLAELPAVQVKPESRIVMAAGPDWYVAIGGDEQVGTMQQIVYRGERVPPAALDAARADARGAALNPDDSVTVGG